MPKIEEHAKSIREAEERQRTFNLDTAQNLEIIRVSANVCQCLSPMVLCMYNFVLIFFLALYFFLACQSSG